ncbi:putative acetyltransferase [Tistlia consotensis]|uniref:Putative acetyltransferase n=1 Tax=Tistlia consotensis USBA 355 TaxID=560819 RepID=A0A1Y6B7T0_9PROT|nr:N-acetyltransferase [Tistlia consotensis]SME88748.1 putative acetyltransferase [Tistlia consotensis USBA 355]SNR25293.1 putative acetyltransferase [Tistlia consotensis]
MEHTPTAGVRVREERRGDAAVVDALIAEAFRGHPYSRGQEPAVMAALRDGGGATLSLVAEEAGAVVGQVAFSAVTLDGRATGWQCLGPLAVRPDRQRLGIGSALIREGLERLRAAGAAGCLLVGDPAYYERFGFRGFPDLTAPGVPARNLLALRFGEALPAGSVGFDPAFSAGEDRPSS